MNLRRYANKKVTEKWNEWQSAVKLERALLELPDELLELESDVTVAWLGKEYLNLHLQQLNEKRANELLEQLGDLKVVKLDWDPKVTHYIGDTFKRRGTLLVGDLEVDLTVTGIPKPPNCRLVPKIHTTTTTTYEVVCEEEEKKLETHV